MEKKQPAKRYLRVTEAAAYLNMSTWKVRELIKKGSIPFIQDNENALWLLDVHDLDEYMQKHKTTKAG